MLFKHLINLNFAKVLKKFNFYLLRLLIVTFFKLPDFRLKNAQKLKFPFHWFFDKNFVTWSKIAFQNKQWIYLAKKILFITVLD